MFIEVTGSGCRGLESIEDQVSTDIGYVVQVSIPDLMAGGVAVDLLQIPKRISLQCEAAEHEDLSGEKNLNLDRIIADDRSSHQAFIVTTQWNSQ